jgi:hypothetical protein
MAATMGWTELPPVFSVMSDTVADVTNRNFESMPRSVLPHQLEEPASRLDDFFPNPLAQGEESCAFLCTSVGQKGYRSCFYRGEKNEKLGFCVAFIVRKVHCSLEMDRTVVITNIGG